MLAEIGYLFNQGTSFCTVVDRLCCNHSGMMFLILCLWFSIENVKNSAISLIKTPHVWELLNCLSCWWLMGDFYRLITTYWHLIYCHLCIYLGTFNVTESRETLQTGKDVMRRFCRFCAYLWWEWRLIWFMQMKVAGVYWSTCNWKALRSKPMLNLTITKVTPTRTLEEHNTGMKTRSENIFSPWDTGADPNCSVTKGWV